jgi:dTDP-4-amino-4,6-dideoxygalactose transaminase
MRMVWNQEYISHTSSSARVLHDLGYKKGDLPESEKAAFETFVLPVFPEMTSEEFSYMIDTLKGFFRKG